VAFEAVNNFDEEDPLKKSQDLNASLGGGGENVVAGSAPVGGQAPQQAGAGPGGTGGWTNIQSYLDANKGGTGSAQALDKAVGSQFGQERNAFQNDSSKFLQDAQSQVDKSRIDDKQASDYINQASGLYSYADDQGKGAFTPVDDPSSTQVTSDGQFSGSVLQKGTKKAPAPSQVESPYSSDQAASYTDIVNKFQNALNKEYTGPKDYNYGFSAKTQNYGSGLKDNAGFDGLMNNLYADSAGGSLTSGQFNLQKQLDVNNKALSDSRQNLSSQYDQLGADRDKTVTDTTKGLSGVEQSYRTNQNRLKDYLGLQSNDYDTAIGQKEGEARSEYNKLYDTGKTGQGSVGGFDSIAREDANGLPGIKLTYDGYAPENQRLGYGQDSVAAARQRVENGIYGDDLTWSQLQREQDKVNPLYRGYWGNTADWTQDLGARKNSLNNFYSTQDNKYADTADKEKRSYNAIQDFLNSSAARKDKKFAVRG
jgi:hypothetical protein